MEVALDTVFVYSLIPFVALSVGGLLGRIREPGPVARAVIQHFAAGVVLGAVAVEILPELRSDHEPVVVVAGMAAGVLLMVAVKVLSERLEARGTSGPTSFLAALAIDVVIDGMLIGVAFAGGEEQGQLLAIIIAVEFVSLGLATGAALSPSYSVQSSVLVATGLGGLAVVAAMVGAAVLSQTTPTVQAVAEAIGAVALVYLVTEELLGEAHSGTERPWYTAVLFAGFTLVFVVVTS